MKYPSIKNFSSVIKFSRCVESFGVD